MAFSWEDILKPVATAVAGIAAGWLGTVARVGSQVKLLGARVTAVEQGITTAANAWAQALVAHKADIARDLQSIKDDVLEMKDAIEEFRKSSTDFAKDAELAKFIMEQGARWERIQHAIGRIEGWLRTTTPESR